MPINNASKCAVVGKPIALSLRLVVALLGQRSARVSGYNRIPVLSC